MYKIRRWNGSVEELSNYSSLLSETYGKEISLEYLVWKHIKNPISKSIIYFAIDANNKIAAARAFWYNYPLNGKFIIQPCDTVTCKNHQRKGLFTKLTLRCLEDIRALHEECIILNFPNNNSAPGYLKLGWERYHYLNKSFSIRFKGAKKVSFDSLRNLNIERGLLSYLEWRFAKNPFEQYSIYYENKVIFIKKGIKIASFCIHDGTVLDIMNAPFGLTVKYSLPCEVNSRYKSIMDIHLPSSSNLVFYDADKECIDNILKKYSPLFLMDTF